ncbi:MAG: hypothetical protein HYX68_05520 [Planctomycetes bacterium]|jgi:hypothetical protein|nr:hypothetical protein [Planctomycetota bacterium]
MTRLIAELDVKTPRREHGFLFTAARWLFAAALLASMLFAHGCHGDEDHELFTTCVEWLSK